MSTADYKRILQGEEPEASAALVAEAKRVADELVSARDLGSEAGKAQVRAVFDEVRQIEALWSTREEQRQKQALHRLHLLKPRVLYRGARSPGLKPLVDWVTNAAAVVLAEKDSNKQKAAFRRLVEFAEAVVAFYRARQEAGVRSGRR